MLQPSTATAGSVCAVCVFVWVFSLVSFLHRLLLFQLGSEADGRSPPPSRYVSPLTTPPQPPCCAEGWTLGDWLQGRERSKDEKERLWFVLSYSFKLNPKLWGTGVKINSRWSALMARLGVKTASEQGAHWHHVLVCFPTPQHLGFLCFISGSRHDGNGEGVQFFPSRTSHWVYWSLNARMLKMIWPAKYRSIGNPLEGQYPGTFSISVLTPCQWPMPSPASVARTFSSNFLLCVCPIAAIDSWTVLMWPRLHSQHITLPLVTLPLFLVQADITWLD